MARLAIANDFLADFSKLEKSVQNSVRATIGKFHEHTQAGVHLEKLHQSRDDRLRTIRVDKFWRGAVLAPESGDTYCLITVLPHDKAMAYVASRRYSVNEALGVLEVRNESALEQARPGLQTIAKTAEQFLFDRVSDADLKRLGVDAQILPIVRLLTSEEHLDALQTMLPEPQYAALYALACGMTPEEAWMEVAQLLTAEAPPRDVDPGDLVTAMERTPGQVAFVSGPGELQTILAHPFAAWRVFLHPSQRRIAQEKTYSGPAQVTGGAGTGKTITALHRAAYLAARLEPPDGDATPPILLTSYTRNLVHALEAQLPLIATDPDLRDRIEILTVDQLASRVVRQAQGRHPAAMNDYELHQLLAAAARAAQVTFAATFLQREWEQVILAQDLQTETDYLECRRAGRGTPLSRDQRRQVWRAVEQATAELRAAGKSGFTQLASQAAQLLRDSGRPPYRHVLVDESQDLHPAQWRLLRAAVAPGPDDLIHRRRPAPAHLREPRLPDQPRHQHPRAQPPSDPELPHHPGDPGLVCSATRLVTGHRPGRRHPLARRRDDRRHRPGSARPGPDARALPPVRGVHQSPRPPVRLLLRPAQPAPTTAALRVAAQSGSFLQPER